MQIDHIDQVTAVMLHDGQWYLTVSTTSPRDGILSFVQYPNGDRTNPVMVRVATHNVKAVAYHGVPQPHIETIAAADIEGRTVTASQDPPPNPKPGDVWYPTGGGRDSKRVKVRVQDLDGNHVHLDVPSVILAVQRLPKTVRDMIFGIANKQHQDWYDDGVRDIYADIMRVFALYNAIDNDALTVRDYR